MSSIITAVLKKKRVQLLIAALAIVLALIALKGINYGIEFEGGVRIPITLISKEPISADTMSLAADTLKQRINKYGLSQSVVRPLGEKEIIVEIPKADENVIKSIEKILREQGRFEALIDGKDALEGRYVLQNAIGGANGERVFASSGSYRWELDFAVTREGGEQFARVALGKANFPVYMMLDRPENAVVIISKAGFNQIGDFSGVEKAMQEALRKDNANIELIYSEDLLAQKARLQDRSRAIISETLSKDAEVISILKAEGFSEDAEAARAIVVRSDAEMMPETYTANLGATTISRWRGVGLLSAPVLSEGLATGAVSQSYSITGTATGATGEEQKRNALSELKELKSVISGGKLPVSTVIGSAYVVAPQLGKQFLAYSFMGIALAIVAVSAIIFLKYRRAVLVVPIIIISMLEIFLTSAIMGIFGTLDLSAVAALIALIGTGVNDQIIITDELLKKGRLDQEQSARSVKERIGKAFYIIFAVAGAILAVMLPLFLSGIVEVTGFALSTIIGVIVGVGITRPAFGEIVEEISAS
ncbi:MAG TPA: hypothetical protein VJI13_01755 [Candidatus Norongarragalinales archaeon]|nr:hypothetical protein [Candidatus Norongarragalinales archaeon]